MRVKDEKYYAWNGEEGKVFALVKDAENWIVESNSGEGEWSEWADRSFIAKILFTTEFKTMDSVEDHLCPIHPEKHVCREDYGDYCEGCTKVEQWPYEDDDPITDLIFKEVKNDEI